MEDAPTRRSKRASRRRAFRLDELTDRFPALRKVTPRRIGAAAAALALVLGGYFGWSAWQEHQVNLARERGPSPSDFATEGFLAPEDNRDRIAVWAENRVVFDVSQSQGFTNPTLGDDGATWESEVPWPAVIDTTNTVSMPGFRARLVWPVVVMDREARITGRITHHRVELMEVPSYCQANIEVLGFARGETADDAAVAGEAVAVAEFGYDTSGWWAVADVGFAPGAETCNLMEILINHEFRIDALDSSDNFVPADTDEMETDE